MNNRSSHTRLWPLSIRVRGKCLGLDNPYNSRGPSVYSSNKGGTARSARPFLGMSFFVFFYKIGLKGGMV